MEINDAIAKSGATCNEAQIFYNLVWSPAIEYTLTQLFLSDTQLHKIKTKLTPLFGMCGYKRNIAYSICHCPIKLGCAGFVPIWASSASGYILHFIKNWQTPTEYVGKNFRIVLAWSQYQVGTSYSIFQTRDTTLDFVDDQICHAIGKYLS